jgi:hypothetical protein
VNLLPTAFILAILGVVFLAPPVSTANAMAAASVGSPFSYFFSVDGSVSETGASSDSPSPYWWVNSGGQMVLEDGRGKTLQGSLPLGSYWRTIYNAANPVDTDLGLHPQNIFRLVGRSLWNNFTQEGYFKIRTHNLSASPNRNQSNGLLFFNRYKDAFNLYYAGIRVDGTAVIKKKVGGVYYTMAQKAIFPGTYNVLTSPNLLPKNTWLGLKTKVQTNTNGSVSINLYLDKGWTGDWSLILSATDSGNFGGTAPITGSGYGGIRTDFMDVEFDQYRMTAL